MLDESFQEIPLRAEELDEDICDERADDISKVNMMRLMKLNSPEWPYITAGCLAAIITGGSLPIFAILFGEIYGVFIKILYSTYLICMLRFKNRKHVEP